MLPALVDLREQYPLPTQDQVIESEVMIQFGSSPWIEGTRSIADELKIRHPTLRKGDDTEPWVMSTDLLLTLTMPNGKAELLAISVKETDELGNERKQQLLQLEREYWRRRGVNWLLLTQRLYDPLVALAVRAGLTWSLGQPPSDTHNLDICASLSNAFEGRTRLIRLA